jgi:hypothetical protein
MLVGALTIGCAGASGPELAPVKGRVVLDGQPLAKGTITTIPPQGRGARAEIGPDGTFELSTGELGLGAVVGLHRVGVVATESSDPGNPEATTKFLAPPQYANPESSGLTIDVKPEGSGEVTLELSSKAN